MMRQAHLARPGNDAAADQARVGDGVMRGTERATAHGPGILKQTGRAIDLGHVEHLIEGHLRKNGREPPGQHGLPGSGRADEKDVVPSGRRHLEGPFDVPLPLDLLKIDGVHRRGHQVLRPPGRRVNVRGAGHQADDLDKVAKAINGEAGDQRRLLLVHMRDDKPLEPQTLDQDGDGEDAGHGLEAPVQGQFADEEIIAQALGGEDPLLGQEAQGDGQIEGRALLLPVGGGQVDGDLPGRDVVTAVLQGGPDALLALPDGRVGQADRDELGESERDVGLDLDGIGLDPGERGAGDPEQHRSSL